jgi:hypothetical protein
VEAASSSTHVHRTRAAQLTFQHRLNLIRVELAEKLSSPLNLAAFERVPRNLRKLDTWEIGILKPDIVFVLNVSLP